MTARGSSDPLGTISTERLEIRAWSAEKSDDIEGAIEIFGDPKVMRWIGNGKTNSDPEATKNWMLRRCGLEDGTGFRAVCRLGDSKPLGSIGLVPLDGGDSIEIGYHFSQRSWGSGFATEASRALTRAAFETLGLEELHAVTQLDNHGSRSVLLKTGLRYRGLKFVYNTECTHYSAFRSQWLDENQ